MRFICTSENKVFPILFSLSPTDFGRGKRHTGYQNTAILRNDFFFPFHTRLDERGGRGGRRVKVQRPAIKDDKGGIKNRLVSEARFALRPVAGGAGGYIRSEGVWRYNRHRCP